MLLHDKLKEIHEQFLPLQAVVKADWLIPFESYQKENNVYYAWEEKWFIQKWSYKEYRNQFLKLWKQWKRNTWDTLIREEVNPNYMKMVI